MNKHKSILILLVALAISFISVNEISAGQFGIPETDHGDFQLVGVFDLRDRETFIQITNTDSSNKTIHIQLFNVGTLCNENNFFDNYTPNDTHVYNLRDIVTNDGNPSGVVLPDNAYGIFVATYLDSDPSTMIGNMRIEDNNGYEYRTNLNGLSKTHDSLEDDFTFNFNAESGIILSDIFGFNLKNSGEVSPPDVFAADIVNIWVLLDIDIFNLNEVPFSCRNIVIACTDQDNPRLEELLEAVGDANVASFEYGINDAVPSSKGAPLLCPSNIIKEGFVRLSEIRRAPGSPFTDEWAIFFIGLNNGNGRGSMDSLWQDLTVDLLGQPGG